MTISSVPDTAAAAPRDASIDVFRYLLLVGVIALHAGSGLPAGHQALWSTLMVDAGNVAVPVYFIAAGYFLRLRHKGWRARIWAPIARLAPLHLFWLGVYTLIFARSVPSYWPQPRDLLTGGLAYHLWFLPALAIGLIVNGLADKAAGRWGALILCLGLALAGAANGAYHDLIGLTGPAQRGGTLMAPLFVWLGQAIGRHRDLRPAPGPMRLWVAALFLLQAVENAAIGQLGHGTPLATQPYTMLTYPLGLAVFQWARSIPADRWPRALVRQSRLSFGAYAVHLMLLYAVSPLMQPRGPGGLALLIAIVFVGASIAARLLAAIPVVRDFVR